MTTVRAHVVLGKKDERVAGPPDADIVVTVPLADAELDPAVAYMRGKLKAVGHTGMLFDALRSGEVARAVQEAAAQA
ncbi:MAG TPA: hypothetical protein VG478_03695 [Acidimicrobiales bacterium]|nr:hypothetical protein [Acidimicrobiales bacterium]